MSHEYQSIYYYHKVFSDIDYGEGFGNNSGYGWGNGAYSFNDENFAFQFCEEYFFIDTIYPFYIIVGKKGN